MAFKGLGSGVQDQLNSWHLPSRILQQLKAAMLSLNCKDPTDLDYDKHGLFLGIKFEDCERPGERYNFDLSICRNDSDFYVASISGFAVDERNDVFWDTNPTI